MVLQLSRDYVTQNITTGNRTYITTYLLAIFLRRLLKYTYVGDTSFPINAISNIFVSTGDTTPTVAPTFPVGNKAGIANNGAAIEVSIPVTIKGVASGDVGRILALKSNLFPTRNSGIYLITAIQQGNATTIAAGSNGAVLPQGTINVASTTGFPASGTIFIGPNTTIAAGSNNVSLPTTTINVLSTTGFPATGSILVLTSTGISTVAYTGITASSFTGCTGGTGTMVTGGTVNTSNNIQTITYTGTNATQFTGCTGGAGTLVTGEPVYNQNKYVIDYRGNGDLSLVEAVDTVEWYLYDKDINCPTQGAVNTQSATSYRGNLDSTTPRIILQSLHALAWQVRLCDETATDFNNGSSNVITITPGFGGNSAGDFPIGGKHLHGALWSNTSVFDFNSGNGTGDNAGAGGIYRYTIMGDDQSVSMIARRPSNGTSPPSFYLTFGLPDNEPAPLPLDNTERLYFLGNAYGNGLGNSRLNDVSLSSGYYAGGNTIQGTAFRYQPISCSPSLWCYLTGNNQFASAIFDASAGDSPFISATELLPVDLVVGTTHNWTGTSAGFIVALPYFPRLIGTVPLLRNGRANFTEYSLTTDNATWSVGVGSPGAGNAATNATPIQITTSAVNTLITGQTVVIHGVLGNTAANGTWIVTVLTSTTFTLNGSVGNGAYTGGGTVLRGASFQHMRRGIFLPWNGPSVVP